MTDSNSKFLQLGKLSKASEIQIYLGIRGTLNLLNFE